MQIHSVSLSLVLLHTHMWCTSAIENPKLIGEPPKSFSFDFSYWSHTDVSQREREKLQYFCVLIITVN